MNKKMSKRQKDIKSKLLAAISMLLVSSIMMVSSTYAWFTLSTAPEVTGVNTSVGANGNLEMALLPTNGVVAGVPESTAQDGNLAIEQKNLTWGNLVDVSSNDVYGTNQFKLYPSQLNVSAEGSIAKSPLSTPEYGADGRVVRLAENTSTARYKDSTFVENSEFGVRGIGTAEGKTPRQAAFSNALSAAVTSRSTAKSLARTSLSTNGAVLAEVALAAALGGEVTTSQLDSLQNIINDLGDILDEIEMSYKQYILAYAASSRVDNDLAWEAITSIVGTKTLAEILSDTNMPTGDELNQLSTLSTSLTDTRKAVEDAQVALDTAKNKDEDLTADDVKAVMTYLANPSKMKLFGMSVSDAKTEEGIKVIVANYKGVLALTIEPEGGVYADIAEHFGDFEANLTLTNVDLSAFGFGVLPSVDASLATVTETGSEGAHVPYLIALGNALSTLSAPATGDVKLVMSDFYGYIIDLAFRTNASNSQLQLQAEAVDRIYKAETTGVEDANNISTMGNGASMTFAAGEGFTDAQMRNLMKSIKIVFFTPDATLATTGTVVGYAALDADNAKMTENGMRAELYMADATGTAADSSAIMTLTQNTATALSVLVYLDGNSVKNGDVGIGGVSMTGTLNLQFSSSATLVPMDYTPLKNTTGTVVPDDEVELPDPIAMTGIAAIEGATAQGAFLDQAVSITLTPAEGKVIDSVASVTVGSTTLDSNQYSYTDGVLKFNYEGMTADTVVTITVATSDASVG